MIRERQDLDKKYLGTVFDRQVRIAEWDQDKLRQQTVLCIGAGGLGSVVIMNLLRLGVKKIIIVDFDKVDIHNLNRQFMYSLADVGKSKVESCIKNAAFHNVGQTVIEGFQGCALSNWQKIISFARESDFVFNMIDYGDWYDAAVQSLCYKLQKPLVMGGTFQLSLSVDYFSCRGLPCFWCLSDDIEKNKEMSDKILPQVILTHQSLKFLPKNNNPTGRSSVVVCTICGEFMVSHFLNYLFFNKQYKTQRLLFYPTTFESVVFPLESDRPCGVCGGKELKKQEAKEQAKEENKDAEKVGEVRKEDQKEQSKLEENKPEQKIEKKEEPSSKTEGEQKTKQDEQHPQESKTEEAQPEHIQAKSAQQPPSPPISPPTPSEAKD